MLFFETERFVWGGDSEYRTGIPLSRYSGESPRVGPTSYSGEIQKSLSRLRYIAFLEKLIIGIVIWK